jgi:pantothenate kinase-related protein Tda10
MWSDGVSKIDMLAYEPYAELIFDIATSERLNPLTIGLFGNWGSGKSTLLSLVDEKIKKEPFQYHKHESLQI